MYEYNEEDAKQALMAFGQDENEKISISDLHGGLAGNEAAKNVQYILNMQLTIVKILVCFTSCLLALQFITSKLSALPLAKRDQTLEAYCLKPHMTQKERALFEKYTTVDTYLEWGTGGSSATFALNARKIFAIDSYKEWCEKVRNDTCVKRFANQFQLYCVSHDNTKIKAWGNPEPIKNEKDFFLHYGEHYVMQSIDELGIEDKSLDFILIDGRYRVACGLHALKLLTLKGVVGIHDYVNREIYHILEEYYEIVEKAESAVIMKPKTGKVDEERLKKLKQQYMKIKSI